MSRHLFLVDEPLPGVKVLSPKVLPDERGFFMESYNQRELAKYGITDDFVQDNHSRSTEGVLRGMHYQKTQPQAKLVRVTRGTVFDVVVDIRPRSRTYWQWAGVELSISNRLMLYVPEGFAHGFVTLSRVAEMQYKASAFYAPQDEWGLPWNDPEIGIEWPIDNPLLSGRDQSWSPHE